MKKLFLFVVISFLIGCSNMNSKLENSITKEVGKEPTKNELIGIEKKSQRFTWNDVSLAEQDDLKNTIDKTFGALPVKTSDLNNETDSLGNTIKGYYYQYWSYINTKYEVELSYNFEDVKPNSMTVHLYITTK